MPTFTQKTIGERIQDYVGDEITLIEGYKDIVVHAFNNVADTIPKDSEMWKVVAQVNLATFLSEFPVIDKVRVLMVTRTDSAGIIRVCEEVPYDSFQRGTDETSIYYNERNYRSPVYSFDETGALVIKPTPLDSSTSAYVFYFAYLTNTDVWDETDGSSFNFPQEALQLAILKAASNLLYAKVSEAVQEEEDMELLQLLQGQIALMDKAGQDEARRIGVPHQLVGDGDDIK